MIVVSIGGGLGNQMFEYAFYEMMKYKYPKQDVKLDIMHTFGKAHNGYEIEKIFKLKAEECTLEELKRLSDYYPLDACNYRFWNTVYKLRRNIFGYKKSFISLKDGSEYQERFFNLNNNSSYYCFGVFANYKYFSEIEEHIRTLYRFPAIQDENNMKMKEAIENSNSVSIHIRRGDYLSWGIKTIPEQYYRDAIKLIQSKVGKCHFFVFTDDVAFVKDTYKDIEDMTVVEGNMGENSFRDMQLMSLCKHNIVANSTFSFWGAFLNKNRKKTVIAPKEPFTGCKFPFVCDEWIVI